MERHSLPAPFTRASLIVMVYRIRIAGAVPVRAERCESAKGPARTIEEATKIFNAAGDRFKIFGISSGGKMHMFGVFPQGLDVDVVVQSSTLMEACNLSESLIALKWLGMRKR